MANPRAVEQLFKLLLVRERAYLVYDAAECAFRAYVRPPVGVAIELIGCYTPSVHRSVVLDDVEEFRRMRKLLHRRYVTSRGEPA